MVAVHLPQDPASLTRYIELSAALEADGYDAVWSGEVNSVEAGSTGALMAAGTTTAEIGVLLNTFTRAPTVLAMTSWTLANLAPGRTNVVLGVASPLLVERWNGLPYTRIHERLRDVLHFLRAAFDGGHVKGDFATFTTSGFALPPVEQPPRLWIAACGPKALALAATEADGVVLNWLGAADIDRIDPLSADRSRVAMVVPMCATADRAVVDQVMRPILADYLQAPAYAAQQRRLGRGPALEPLWNAWAAGDRKAAHAALPASVIDELVVWGDPASCRRQVEEIERTTGVRVIATYFAVPGTTFEDLALRGDHPA